METQVILALVRGQEVFSQVQLSPGESRCPNSTPFVIPKNDMKPCQMMVCTPGNAANLEPPPPPLRSMS